MRLFLVIGFFFSSWNISGQVDISAQLDSNYLLVGDYRKLTLQIVSSQVPDQIVDDLKVWDSIPNLQIIHSGEWRRHEKVQAIFEKSVTFSVYDSGYYVLPGIPIAWSIQNNSGSSITNDLAVQVNIVSADTTGLAPIKDIIGEKKNWTDYKNYIIILGACLLIIILAYFIRKRLNREPTEIDHPLEVPNPYEVAIKKLRNLQSKKLWQSGQIKEYHSDLTYLVREFIEGSTGILALESTSDEIIRDMDKSGFDQDYINNIRNVFSIADMVKFAKAKPNISVHEDAFNTVESFLFYAKNHTLNQILEEE